MLQSEFENLTGIFPDVLLYEAAEHEYNTGDFASKAEFCDCFKADEDGLATKVQKAANERWFEMEKQRGALITANEQLQKENAELKSKSGHMSTLEIVTDLALTICIALLMTIAYYMKNAHDMGFLELIKNAFAYIF